MRRHPSSSNVISGWLTLPLTGFLQCDGKEPCSACEDDPKDCLYPNAQVSVKYVSPLFSLVGRMP